ncbi:pinin SDK memA [Aspergillus sclerotialis]|uniref:Pinin SDK memA n=1 Tax=Aspergillus sclerotialis TaxID=2070753 RepID=A0A3A2ZR41_9EURO|nr:pinin SDK memA [Aspergillus sclerotialis]
MAETLASAVALPDHDNLPPSPETNLKRRKSSTTDRDHNPDADPDNKRRRLSSQNDQSEPQSRRQSIQSPGDRRNSDRRPSRQTGGREEERKRGQRLFGGLLGTLSQSSNSAAQKRRADIERRQQDKLKLQYEELDEQRKKRKDELVAIRWKEKRLFEEESMRTRHSNLLAMAHFLKTRTEPVLYYKPYELRREDEDTIRDQVDEAESIISREVAEFEARYPPQDDTKENKQENRQEEPDQSEPPALDTHPKEAKDTANEASDTVGAETNLDQSSKVARTDITPTNDHNAAPPDQTDVHRGADDDGGEVEEDKEDTVIY